MNKLTLDDIKKTIETFLETDYFKKHWKTGEVDYIVEIYDQLNNPNMTKKDMESLIGILTEEFATIKKKFLVATFLGRNPQATIVTELTTQMKQYLNEMPWEYTFDTQSNKGVVTTASEEWEKDRDSQLKNTGELFGDLEREVTINGKNYHSDEFNELPTYRQRVTVLKDIDRELVKDRPQMELRERMYQAIEEIAKNIENYDATTKNTIIGLVTKLNYCPIEEIGENIKNIHKFLERIDNKDITQKTRDAVDNIVKIRHQLNTNYHDTELTRSFVLSSCGQAIMTGYIIPLLAGTPPLNPEKESIIPSVTIKDQPVFPHLPKRTQNIGLENGDIIVDIRLSTQCLRDFNRMLYVVDDKHNIVGPLSDSAYQKYKGYKQDEAFSLDLRIRANVENGVIKTVIEHQTMKGTSEGVRLDPQYAIPAQQKQKEPPIPSSQTMRN